MSEKIIHHSDGSATVFTDSYALFGTKVVGAPSRPEKTTEERERERRADRIGYSEMRKKLFPSWTDEDFDTAKRFTFPDALGHRKTGVWSSEPFYSRAAIDRWRAEILKFSVTLE